MKQIKFLTLFITIIFILTGCQVSRNKGESSINSSVSSSYDTKTDVKQLKLQNDTYTELKHNSTSVINLEQFKLQTLNIPLKGTISAISCINNKLIVEIYPDDEKNCVELGVFDPYNNTYKKINRVPFSAAYGEYSCVLQDRYFIMASCNEVNGEMNGNIIMYDIQTDSLKTVDKFKTHNIVEFLTPVGENAIAYFYYEAQTQDWVVKHYDIEKNNSKEIFRHTNLNDIQISPMSITSDGKDIALVIQFVEGDVYHTQLAWITPEGDWCKTEEIDLYNFFKKEYEITDFKINNNNYYLKAKINDDEEYFILNKDSDNFHLTLPAICHLNKISNSITDESNIIFLQNTPVLGDLVSINLNNSSFDTYEFSQEISESNTIAHTKISKSGDLFVFYSSDNSEYKFQVIPEYKTKADTPFNPGLYVSPRQQYEEYVNSEYATPEGIEELKKTTEEAEKQMSQNDFRWNFVFNVQDN